MGLNLILYDLRRYEEEGDYGGDDRFDTFRHYEDRSFAAWLNAQNAVFKVVGPPDVLDEVQRYYNEAQRRLGVRDTLKRHMERYCGERHQQGFGGPIRVFERPKNFVAARAWVRNYVHPMLEDWDRTRFSDLLDLMESDENLWLYESQ